MRNDIQTRKVASRRFAHPVSMSWKMENSSKYCFRYTCKPGILTCHVQADAPDQCNAFELTKSSLNSLLDT